MSKMHEVLQDKFYSLLSNSPSRGQGVHHFCFRAANLGLSAGLSESEAVMAIKSAVADAERGEVEEAVRNARKTHKRFDNIERMSFKPNVQFKKLPLMELIEMSPVRLLNDPCDDWKLLFEALFSPDESIYIGDKYTGRLETVMNLLRNDSKSVTAYPFFVINPLTGQGIKNPETGKISYRSIECVASFRNMLFESDTLDIEEQSFLFSRLVKYLPVISIVYSGGKSLHAIVRIKASDYNEYQQIAEKIFTRFEYFSIDKACRNPNRMSRLPGHIRNETNNQQQIVYLNPNA